MAPSDVTLSPLSTRGRDLDEAAVVAARAFHHDPFFTFLEPGAIRRARFLALFYRSALVALGSTGQVTGARRADGRLIGVAAWIPPGGYPLPVRAQLRDLVGAAWAMALRPRAAVDGTRYLLTLDRAHPREPLWYLFLLVVDPSAQRSGIGARLQMSGIDAADREGVGCWLETQTPDNLPYYRRFGYDVVDELRPVPHGPPLWTMRRPTAS